MMMVDRYDPWFDGWDGVVVMDVEHDGDWVSYDDYKAQAARIEQLEAAIKRQASAAKTLRDLTLSEVQHLKDKDRSEYVAAKTVDSEREANDILTDRVEHLEAANEALKSERVDIIATKREQLSRLEAQLATARNDALRDAAALMETAAANCRNNFTHPPKNKEQRDYQTAALIHANASRAISAIITKEAP